MLVGMIDIDAEKVLAVVVLPEITGNLQAHLHIRFRDSATNGGKETTQLQMVVVRSLLGFVSVFIPVSERT